MVELKPTFLPLVFAELYRALAAESRYADALDDHLADIGLGADWLGEAADAYSRKWTHILSYATNNDLAANALSEEHSQFATWVLSCLSVFGDSAGLSTDLRSSVLESAFADVDELAAPVSSTLSPTIIGWTLGTVIGGAGSSVLAAPVIQPSDDNVRVAYSGLLEHVLALQNMPQPWPEMMQTAMYWRGFGLVEALRPEEASGAPALRVLRRESQQALGGDLNVKLSRHLDEFGNRRNALSHIADLEGRPRFVDVIDQERASSSLELTVRAMTQFVFQEVANEVRKKRPRVVRHNVWEYLEREIHVWE